MAAYYCPTNMPREIQGVGLLSENKSNNNTVSEISSRCTRMGPALGGGDEPIWGHKFLMFEFLPENVTLIL